MRSISILWVDDEIDLLKPHIIFLRDKGYVLETANNGDDAIGLCKKNTYDLLFLDENMPGLSGLQTLSEIKKIAPGLPVVMITKSEEENIMDQAIGSQICDYLIKPVNPNQILLTIKKNIDQKRLVTEKTAADYRSEFGKLGIRINDSLTFDNWTEVYKSLIYWELELEQSHESTMDQVLKMQKTEANSAFAKFVKKNYFSWFDEKNQNKPLLSPSVVKTRVLPFLKENKKVFLIVIDNLRFDQWKMIQPVIQENWVVQKEELFSSILPTATQYARNAMFAGLMPSEIQKMHPGTWLNDEEEGGKNLHEEELMKKQLSRNGLSDRFYYDKINNNKTGKKLCDNINNVLGYPFAVIIYNFVDMLSHARTEMEMIRELANDEAAYRSLTLSWFQHSPLLELLKILSGHNVKVVLTTDHGTIRVNNPIKVIGDKNTTTNLRYKQGKNLNYNPKEVFEVTQPAKAHLPLTNVSSSYIFATNNDFFAYPNNFNYYATYYKDTFQHGGISLEEMLVPLITLSPK